MKFEKLVEGRLIKRYKRFLADVELADGAIVTAHCTNTGSMDSCLEDGARVLLSPSPDPTRKTRFTWEMIYINNNWVGVNTQNSNKIAFELVEKNAIRGLENLTDLKREVKYFDSRFDLFGFDGTKEVWMEVKNVSMKRDDWALFPDAVTERGQKHLRTLMKIVESGQRAAMIYMIQRTDISKFRAAHEVDAKYAQLLEEAKRVGVEVYPVQVQLNEQGIEFYRSL